MSWVELGCRIRLRVTRFSAVSGLPALPPARSMILRCVPFLLCLPGLAPAEVYQWRDSGGTLHFSDKKPNTQQVEAIVHRVKATNVDDSGLAREPLGRLFKPETPAEQSHRQRQQARQAKQQLEHQQRCDSARQHLAVLQGPVYFVREDGSRYDVSEAERARQVGELESIIHQNCD